MRIQIPNPCHENWADMSIEAQGRFCQNCQKTVIDFTSMSDKQVAVYYKSHPNQPICGRFKTTQINRKLIEDIEIKQSNRHPAWKYMIWSVLAVGGFANTQMLYSQDSIHNVNVTIAKDSLLETPYISIKGTVRDDENKKPIPNAMITMTQGDIAILSDENGFFEIAFPTAFLHQTIELAIQATSYEQVIQKITLQENNRPIIINMKYEGVCVTALSSSMTFTLGLFSIRTVPTVMGAIASHSEEESFQHMPAITTTPENTPIPIPSEQSQAAFADNIRKRRRRIPYIKI